MNLEPECPRCYTERMEHVLLCPQAAFSDASRGRDKPEEPCQLRTCYQRDRDRVVHSRAFRRLKHKTQVFLSPEGDHYRTRLTHTIEVAQIARTIARALRLNEDLTEAIAMAHDLGHTPFGHAGERALDACYAPGFHHYEQSVRVVEKIEKQGKGLNLTQEVRNGVLRHTNGPWADTLEGCIVRVSDRIAYINHDIDDAERAGILREEDIPMEIRQALGFSKSQRINTLVTSVIRASGETIAMEPEIEKHYQALHAFLFDHVYTNPIAKGEESKVGDMVKWLFEYYVKNPDALPDDFVFIRETEGVERAAVDHIAAMTDRYADWAFEDLFIPRSWKY